MFGKKWLVDNQTTAPRRWIPLLWCMAMFFCMVTMVTRGYVFMHGCAWLLCNFRYQQQFMHSTSRIYYRNAVPGAVANQTIAWDPKWTKFFFSKNKRIVLIRVLYAWVFFVHNDVHCASFMSRCISIVGKQPLRIVLRCMKLIYIPRFFSIMSERSERSSY